MEREDDDAFNVYADDSELESDAELDAGIEPARDFAPTTTRSTMHDAELETLVKRRGLVEAAFTHARLDSRTDKAALRLLRHQLAMLASQISVLTRRVQGERAARIEHMFHTEGLVIRMHHRLGKRSCAHERDPQPPGTLLSATYIRRGLNWQVFRSGRHGWIYDPHAIVVHHAFEKDCQYYASIEAGTSASVKDRHGDKYRRHNPDLYEEPLTDYARYEAHAHRSYGVALPDRTIAGIAYRASKCQPAVRYARHGDNATREYNELLIGAPPGHILADAIIGGLYIASAKSDYGSKTGEELNADLAEFRRLVRLCTRADLPIFLFNIDDDTLQRVTFAG
jgi:hypothetical protein